MIGVKLVRANAMLVRRLISSQYSTVAVRKSLEYNPVYAQEPSFIVRSAYDDISISDLTLDEYTWRHFKNWENKVAIVSIIRTINFELISLFYDERVWTDSVFVHQTNRRLAEYLLLDSLERIQNDLIVS